MRRTGRRDATTGIVRLPREWPTTTTSCSPSSRGLHDRCVLGDPRSGVVARKVGGDGLIPRRSSSGVRRSRRPRAVVGPVDEGDES